MRLVSLCLVEDPNSSLTFHPRLTVVFGLTPEARAFLTESLSLMVNGQSAGVFAQVDMDGTLIDVGPGYRRVPAPIQPVNCVVRAQDLLEPRMSAVSRKADAAEPVDLPDQLVKAKRQHQAATASLHALADSIQRLHAEATAAADSQAAIRAALDAARRDADPGGSTALRSALDAARQLEVEMGADFGVVRADTIDTVKQRIEQLEVQIAAVDDALASLPGQPTAGVDAALEDAQQVAHPGPIVSRRAVELADQWVRLRDQLADIEARYATADGSVSAISDRLDAARQELVAAEAGSKPRTLTSDDIRDLETAHEAVLEAERKATGRLGGNRAKRQLDVALAHQQAVLDRVGFPTWSAFVMGDRMLDSTKDAKQRVVQLQSEVDRLERQWASLSAQLDADAEFGAALDRIDVVYAEARELVGDVDDLEAALRDVRVDPAAATSSPEDAQAQLAAALRAVGIELDYVVSLDELCLHAERWLADARAIDVHRVELTRDAEEARAEMADARATLDRIETLGAPDDTGIVENPKVRSVRAAIADSTARVARHRAALAEISRLSIAAIAAGENVRRAEADHAAKLELMEVTTSMERAALARVSRIEAAMRDESPIVSSSRRSLAAGHDESTVLGEYLDKRAFASQPHSLAGPLPMLLDDCFAGLNADMRVSLLHRINRTAERTQFLYLTSESDIADWVALNLSPNAMVVTGTGFFSPSGATFTQ
jgi:chromosome segregation ATPase